MAAFATSSRQRGQLKSVSSVPGRKIPAHHTTPRTSHTQAAIIARAAMVIDANGPRYTLDALERILNKIAPEAPKAEKTKRKTAGERCEDGDCVVDGDGHAACGRLACPSCGSSGDDLVVAGPGEPVFCRCGHSFVPGW